MKKQFLLLSTFLLTAAVTQAQLKVGNNPTTISPSAVLEVRKHHPRSSDTQNDYGTTYSYSNTYCGITSI